MIVFSEALLRLVISRHVAALTCYNQNMKKHWIEFRESWVAEPMTFWVHKHIRGYSGQEMVYEPPLQKLFPGKGFPAFFVEVDGFTFRFASLQELQTCINVLSERNFPSSLRTSGYTKFLHVANNHWLNRLPKETKTWRYRQKAVKYLGKALEEFQNEVTKRP